MENEPCDNCLLRPVCINKNWKDIVDDCDLMCDYLCDNSNFEDSKHSPFVTRIHIKTLNKTFAVTAGETDDAQQFAIGEHWKPTVDNGGYADGEYQEVRVIARQYESPPTMLMKTYHRSKDGKINNSQKE